MSSSFSADTVSGYLGLYVEWSSNVHVAEGYSDVTVKLYVDSYAIYSQPYVIRCDITIDNSYKLLLNVKQFSFTAIKCVIIIKLYI